MERQLVNRLPLPPSCHRLSHPQSSLPRRKTHQNQLHATLGTSSNLIVNTGTPPPALSLFLSLDACDCASYYLVAKKHVQETVIKGGKARGAFAAEPRKDPSAANDKTEDPGEKLHLRTPPHARCSTVP